MNVIIAMVAALVLGFALSALLGRILVPWLHKLKFGQTILDIGPNWHKQKQGTPTMGGLMFIAATVVSFVLIIVIDKIMGGDLIGTGYLVPGDVKAKIYGGVLMALGFGIIGFLDDYIKVRKKQNEGLTVIQKTILQVLVSGAYIATLILSGNRFLVLASGKTWDYGGTLLFCIFTFIVIYATVNAVNFTDGIDGLCSSVTITAAVAFAAMALVRECFGAGVLASALAGACAGYLIWNWHPAKCFMGDTGSMFLGGMVVALAYAIDNPLILLLAGIIYVAEGASDVIQILYFKLTRRIARRTDPNATGKRLFKMAPIHHHFEKSGWSEEKICIVFSIINLCGGAIGFVLYALGG